MYQYNIKSHSNKNYHSTQLQIISLPNSLMAEYHRQYWHEQAQAYAMLSQVHH